MQHSPATSHEDGGSSTAGEDSKDGRWVAEISDTICGEIFRDMFKTKHGSFKNNLSFVQLKSLFDKRKYPLSL